MRTMPGIDLKLQTRLFLHEEAAFVRRDRWYSFEAVLKLSLGVIAEKRLHNVLVFCHVN